MVRKYFFPGTYKLQHPLGDWKKGGGHTVWNFFQDSKTKVIYKRRTAGKREQWTKHRSLHNRYLTLNAPTVIPCKAPMHAFRVSFKSVSSQSWMLYGFNSQPMKTSPPHKTQAQHAREDTFLERLYGYTPICEEVDIGKLAKLAAAIHCGTAVGGSDGSVVNQEMVLGWALENKEGMNCRIEGAGIVDGDPKTNDSTRAERGGRANILGVILHLAREFDIQKGHVKILIDNTTAITYGERPGEGSGPFKHLPDDYDIKCWTKILEERLQREHGIKVTYKHVHSHQDDPVKVRKIYGNTITPKEAAKIAANPGREALLNIACDEAANRGRQDLAAIPRENPIAPKEAKVVLNIGGTHVYRNIKDQIEWATHHKGLEEHLEEKNKWGEAFARIDWEAHGKAFSTLPRKQKVAVCKGNFNWRATNARMNVISPDTHPSSLRPICGKEEETSNHIYQCGHHSCSVHQMCQLEDN